ncbi:hypothetical protein KCP69_19145 [Salmonella enterica subsp. enterica]|nr:hypothetical protein KCP69_19145 [Salmonella enterica subsp. enterica]
MSKQTEVRAASISFPVTSMNTRQRGKLRIQQGITETVFRKKSAHY